MGVLESGKFITVLAALLTAIWVTGVHAEEVEDGTVTRFVKSRDGHVTAIGPDSYNSTLWPPSGVFWKDRLTHHGGEPDGIPACPTSMHDVEFWPADEEAQRKVSEAETESEIAGTEAAWEGGRRKFHSANMEWKFGPEAEKCKASVLDKEALRNALRCKTIAFVGDSIVRHLAQRLLTEADYLKFFKHNDKHHKIEDADIQVDFFWQPRVAGIVETVVNWTSIGYVPDIIVTSSGAHSMFAHHTAEEYRAALTTGVGAWKAWRNALDEDARPTIYWVTLSAVNTWRIDFEHMSGRSGFQARALAEYNDVQRETVFAADKEPASERTFELLDFLSISNACGRACTGDGLHFSGAVNTAAIQVMANMYAATDTPANQRVAAGRCEHDRYFEDRLGKFDAWRAL